MDIFNNSDIDLFLDEEVIAEVPSSNSNMTVSGPSPIPPHIMQIVLLCQRVLVPVICSVGILGNGLSLCVLTRREMTAATTCFLTALAVSDLVLLILQVPMFLGLNADLYKTDSFQTFIRYYSVIRYVMTNVFVTCTCWLTVAVTTERFVSLRFMLHPKLACTIPRARKAIVAIFLASFIFHFSKFFDYIPNPNLDSPHLLMRTELAKSTTYETYLHITNISLVVIIPVIILIGANAFLIFFLTTHRRRMLRHNPTATSNMTAVDMLHVTAIVVATVVVFIACHSISLFIALSIASTGGRKLLHQPSFYALKEINTLLIMVNSSVNFLLYCAISRKFRSSLVHMFQRRLHLNEGPWSNGMPLSDNSVGTFRSTRAAAQSTYTPPPSTGSSHSSVAGQNGHKRMN